MSQVQEFYRKDIDGLRAIAILAVVAYHAGLPGVLGGFVGVDVFFVLSGYLITSLLIAEARRNATISLRSFYARRVRRLLPALFFVVSVTCILGFFMLLPVFNQQQDLARSGVATAMYVSNFYFWLATPGYFDQSSDLSPLLHTWSLSVEEQYYMVWPLMVLGTAWLAHNRRWDFERTLLVLTVTIFLTSFVWCIRTTQVAPTAAFYLLPSRAWELATGALLALWLPRLPSATAAVGGACSFLGVAAIAFAVMTFRAEMAFPGYLAAVPVFGTALVVAGGHLAAKNPVQVLLSTRPMVLIGLLSYSWYLWHWPLLALTRAYLLEERNLTRDLGLAALSLMLAYASYRLVENPIRFGRPGPFRRTETTLAAGLVISLAMCLPAGALGAWAKLVGSKRGEFAPIIAARNDRPALRSNCHQRPPFENLTAAEKCTTGSSDTPPAVVLWGDSHADHLSPLMQSFAASSPLTSAVVRSFNSCPPLGEFRTGDARQDEACGQFNSAVLAEIKELSGNGLRGVVLSGFWLDVFGAATLQTIAAQRGGTEPSLQTPETVKSLAATVERLTSLGLKILIVAPTPVMKYEIPSCLARRRSDQCGVERTLINVQRREVTRLLLELESLWPNVHVIDFIDSLCDSKTCFATQDGQILYLDRHHLTASASRALLPAARESLLWITASGAGAAALDGH
jgi:peptidoglycan/LPS O-acetylase OafA/YrhL